MMNENKKMGIFIIVIALILLAGMLIYTYGFKKSQNANNNNVQEAITGPVKDLMAETKKNVPAPNLNFDAQAEANRQLGAEDIRKMALPFVERFGSYSNQSNYSNFEDLKMFMSDKMKSWSDDNVAELKKTAGDAKIYHGITTIAVSAVVKKFDDKAGEAEILVSTQRRESGADSANTNVYTQNIILDFVKIKNEWKVDAAYWQK